ncbi:MAG: ABC transporter substrate-binding protein [Amylibacter sp.]|nr:ABC transporter substrate-binding protein [Amylibacter sp.]
MPISKFTSRRVFLGGLTTSVALTTFSTAGFALTKQEAEILIGKLSSDIFKVINSGKSGNAMYRDFDGVMGKYAAINAIARTVLGPPWRSATPAQQSAYIKAFRGYLSRKYGKRFREFIGSEIKVVSARKVKSGVLVKSVVTFKGSAPFTVDWQVFERNGKQQMFDLYIEGISMIKSEREEVGSMLDRSGGKIDKLIKKLNAAG